MSEALDVSEATALLNPMSAPALPDSFATIEGADAENDRPSIDLTDALSALRAAIDFAFVAADQEIYGADGQPHAFEVTFDGDGYNEPYSVSARCVCGGWSHDWFQPDPAQTGRPDVADLLLEWVEHYDLLLPASRMNAAPA